MKGLPDNINFTPLIGRTIEVVSIGKFHINLYLDDKPNAPKIWIEIESDELIFIESAGKIRKIDNFRTDGGLLSLLIDLTIQSVSRKEDGGVIIRMSTGVILEIGIHASMYESIVLHIGEEVFVG